MQWGETYRSFHREAWRRVYDLLRPGGYFILNVKDHYRKKTKQPVCAWHDATVQGIGFTAIGGQQVAVSGLRMGENHESRTEYEMVFVYQKPWQVDEHGNKYAEHRLGRA